MFDKRENTAWQFHHWRKCTEIFLQPLNGLRDVRTTPSTASYFNSISLKAIDDEVSMFYPGLWNEGINHAGINHSLMKRWYLSYFWRDIEQKS